MSTCNLSESFVFCGAGRGGVWLTTKSIVLNERQDIFKFWKMAHCYRDDGA